MFVVHATKKVRDRCGGPSPADAPTTTALGDWYATAFHWLDPAVRVSKTADALLPAGPRAPSEVSTMYPEIDHGHAWRSVVRQRFEIAMRHSTASYVGWLRTDSLVNSLGSDRRSGFLHDIEHLIASSYQGTVERNFLYDLVVARRAPDPRAPR